MNKFIQVIKSDKIIFRGFVISFFVNIFAIIFILLNYKSLPPYIPIFNQLPWGDPRFMETSGIFITIIIFFLIFILNFIFASLIYNKNPLIGRMLASTTLLVSIINFIYIIRTILIIL